MKTKEQEEFELVLNTQLGKARENMGNSSYYHLQSSSLVDQVRKWLMNDRTESIHIRRFIPDGALRPY